ncbi:MAG TPA: Uma2 family endonuclease [Solirubrobacteraceae bacterium]
MPLVVLDPLPVEIESLLERRRRLGQDRGDEMWDGVLHVNPSPHGRHHRIQHQLAILLDEPARAAGLVPALGDFNIGDEDNYRAPDGGLHRPGPDELFYPTVALAVEIVSPGDESWKKLPFYAAHDVEEVLIVDPLEREVHWLGLRGGEYGPIERSALIDYGKEELAGDIDWPEPSS